MLLYETFLGVPYMTPWLGVKRAQRMASICEVPVYFLYPLLSHMSGDEHLRFILAAILLITGDVCVNVVSGNIYASAGLA